MGTTTNLKLPYPELSDQADGPDAFGDLAVATEAYFYNRTLPTGVTRAPTYHWGSGTTYPTAGVVTGDTFVHTGLGPSTMRWNGSAWRQVEPAEVANAAARIALATTNLHPMFRVYEADTGRLLQWINGWRLMTQENFTNGSLNPNNQLTGPGWASTAFLWTAQLGNKITIPADRVTRRVELRATVEVSAGAGSVRIRDDIPGGSLYWPNPNGIILNPNGGESTAVIQGAAYLDGTRTDTFYLECARYGGSPTVNFVVPTLSVTTF